MGINFLSFEFLSLFILSDFKRRGEIKKNIFNPHNNNCHTVIYLLKDFLIAALKDVMLHSKKNSVSLTVGKYENPRVLELKTSTAIWSLILKKFDIN